MATILRPESALAVPLADRFHAVRRQSLTLCAPLETEDYVVCSMPDVSPTKWHLAHTSWFFETFVLAPHLPGYVPRDPFYAFLFNSYYVQAGERHCRAQRGLVTRPTVREVLAYRAHVDEAVDRLCALVGDDPTHPVAPLLVLGLHHEQQHPELLLTDIKHVFWTNPVQPAYRAERPALAPFAPLGWLPVAEGVHEIGYAGTAFHFDNEAPRHRTYVPAGALATRLVTNTEFAEFIADGGYRQPALWLSAGWAQRHAEGWQAPLYWSRRDDTWHEFTLHGTHPIDPHAPVTHVSYYEADAYARWQFSGVRLARAVA